ncbi:UbiA family prenyltransferase [Niabella yanshanensis]|uniref:UbiA family prenyltransferase n=1 Tax=Niabella yanshanensis TaxID=577386 RepID=A0ABZ0W5X5_9BACT|nr:UbiA family prenyltransferase [Niabella yanshanensis]WQD38334.1 UbiA family prenyltransferase [Niabella yanshanensis]
MNLARLVRSHDWWDYKLPPILAVGYATLLLGNRNIFDYYGYIAIILLSVVVGAIYVSIINDVSDIEVDQKAGKFNKMAALPPFMRWLLPLACLSVGAAFICFFYYPDILSCIFYTIPWIAFSMYSFQPFRLKNRGIWGVLADASGAHIFISLLMVSSLCCLSGQNINYAWLAAVFVWATCGGLRGILWHQFTDRENDIKSGIKTFATARNPGDFKKIEWFILATELAALALMLSMLNNLFVYIAMIAYLVLMLLRYTVLRQQPIPILHNHFNYQILLLDFTDLFFPVALLLYASMNQPDAWIVLCAQLLLFPARWIMILKDIYRILFKRRRTKTA